LTKVNISHISQNVSRLPICAPHGGYDPGYNYRFNLKSNEKKSRSIVVTIAY